MAYLETVRNTYITPGALIYSKYIFILRRFLFFFLWLLSFFFLPQLQSEHFPASSSPDLPNVLREKLILFLAFHFLCAPKLSEITVCFPSSVQKGGWAGGGGGWGGCITVELALYGWLASRAWFRFCHLRHFTLWILGLVSLHPQLLLVSSAFYQQPPLEVEWGGGGCFSAVCWHLVVSAVIIDGV